MADVEQDDGEGTERHIVIRGWLHDGTPLREISVPAKEFDSMSWVMREWGARIIINPGRNNKELLRHAIQTLSRNMESRSTFTHTGWRMIDGKRVYLHAGGAIGASGVKTELTGNLKNYTFPTDNDTDLVQAVRESIKLLDVAPARVTYPIWAAMYLAPLTEILPPVFVLNVEGASGSLKSSLTAVMLNHFGKDFHEYAMPADWLATANSLERLSFLTKDAPLVIDDLRPTDNTKEANELQSAVSKIVRAAGNRQGRGRLDSNSNLKRTFAPRGVVLMTAERGAVGKSVVARMMNIDVEPNDVDPARLMVAQKQRHIYGYAMRGYIEHLAQRWDVAAKWLQDKIVEVRAEIGGDGQHKRLPNAAATLYAAFHNAICWAESIGAITPQERQRRLNECFDVLKAIAVKQNEITEEQDPALKFMTVLATLLAQGKAYIQRRDIGRCLGNKDGERLGWWDGSTINLLPAAYPTVVNYVRSEGRGFPSDQYTLGKELERKGYVADRDKDSVQVLRRDPSNSGKQTRVYALKYSALVEIAQSLTLNENDLSADGQEKAN